MTFMQERAVNIINEIPEDKLFYVIQLLESVNGLSSAVDGTAASPEQSAYDELQKYRRPGMSDIDYNAELARAREEKYAGSH